MRFLLSVLLSLCLGSTAFAAGGGGGGGGGSSDSGTAAANRFLTFFNRGDTEAEDAEAEEEDDPRSFTLPSVVTPLADENGRLTGFAFVLIRVRVAQGRNVWSIQENTHYSLDALVRSAHRIDLSTENGRELNEDRAIEVWSAVMNEMHGVGSIENLEIRSYDLRFLQR